MNNEIGDPNNQGNISNYPIMTIFVTMLWRGGKGAKVHYKIIFFFTSAMDISFWYRCPCLDNSQICSLIFEANLRIQNSLIVFSIQ